ncbi:hypothetical protein Lpar_0996 [Legionella parisiensis]|uniref:Uncharacterized protein n=1 Tax=Legionella parisiensis TaxID=45071 RepID=A0A1E5JSJ4_9GAMM|nr:hypothetical protein Lpar_0996 [Legionella parisiensis]OEH47504.1 hypothetical protein lpari_01427 [Legionella parisiensis]STX77907.1 Uncharacterised protein [Legionella parisiensis]
MKLLKEDTHLLIIGKIILVENSKNVLKCDKSCKHSNGGQKLDFYQRSLCSKP